MAPKSSFGHPGVRFLRFWEGLIEVRFLMNFWAAPQIKRILKKWGGGVKRATGRQGSAEEAWSPKSFWSLQIDKNSSEFAKAFQTPCPLRAGGGGLLYECASASTAAPSFIAWGLLRLLFASKWIFHDMRFRILKCLCTRFVIVLGLIVGSFQFVFAILYSSLTVAI